MPFFIKTRMSNSEKYRQLRQQYPVFCYESFQHSVTDRGLLVRHRFTAGSDIVFEPETLIPSRSFVVFRRLSQRH